MSDNKQPWFTCAICHKHYSLKNNLKRHIRSCHQDIRHHCKLCPSVFKRKEYLLRHMKNLHQDEDSNQAQAPVPSTSTACFVSTGSQTKKTRLAKTPSTRHTGTGTPPVFQKDKATNTDNIDSQVMDRGTSPIMWGNLRASPQVIENQQHTVEEYHTSPPDWTSDLQGVEEYFTQAGRHSNNTPADSNLESSTMIEDIFNDNQIIDFDLLAQF